ncbi:unknown [Firmicutes bacterium CAG:137]|nr:unknown [Firmicutes bacterium CAG:137]
MGSISMEMSMFLSTYSRIWVELTVSHQAGRETSFHFPRRIRANFSPVVRSTARRKITWL